MKILLLIILTSVILSSAQFKTVPSEFPEGTDFFDTGYPKTIYLGESQGDIFSTFNVPLGSSGDKLFTYSKSESKWIPITSYSRQEFGRIRKVGQLKEELVIWTSNSIYVTENQNQLKELQVPFKEYDLSVNEFGYNRRIADVVVKNSKIYIASEFQQRFNEIENNFLFLSEVLILDSNFELEHYFRTHSDRFSGFNDVDSIPYGLGIKFLHVKSNGDLIATGSELTIKYYDEPNFLLFNSTNEIWNYNPIGYPESEFGNIKFTPQFLALNNNDEEIIAHNTRNPNTDMLFYNGALGWENFGTQFSQNPLPDSFINFSSVPEYNGYVNIMGEDYLFTATHGLIKFDQSNLSFKQIFVHDEEIETAFISKMVVSGDLAFVELQPKILEPSRLYKLEIETNSVNNSDDIGSRILEEICFDTMGKKLNEDEIGNGLPYLKIIKYQNGNVVVKKLIK